MGGRQPLKIPFPSKDPRYYKCWNLIRKQGLSLEDALAAAERLRNETPDVDVKIERLETGSGRWTWKVTRVVQT